MSDPPSAGMREKKKERTRETIVEVPLRVCGEFHGGLSRRWMKRKLRRLLRTVPVYARLLDEYPAARITVAGSRVKLDDPYF